jgi:hypothetical protein
MGHGLANMRSFIRCVQRTISKTEIRVLFKVLKFSYAVCVYGFECILEAMEGRHETALSPLLLATLQSRIHTTGLSCGSYSTDLKPVMGTRQPNLYNVIRVLTLHNKFSFF